MHIENNIFCLVENDGKVKINKNGNLLAAVTSATMALQLKIMSNVEKEKQPSLSWQECVNLAIERYNKEQETTYYDN